MVAAATCRAILLSAAAVLCTACAPQTYDPAWATRPYPEELHTASTVDMHVFRKGESIQIVNSTARSYANVDIWLNQRFVQHVPSLDAGETISLSLWEFKDENGDCFNAGGFFRTVQPAPVRLVEIQPAPDQPLLGLITIRSETIVLRRPPQ